MKDHLYPEEVKANGIERVVNLNLRIVYGPKTKDVVDMMLRNFKQLERLLEKA